ncbi:MAG: ClpXP protease specificity-enhancing factor [Methylococcales bacterium]
MRELSTKPYLIRAIHAWCTDSGLTPYLMVAVDAQTRVPPEFVKNGEIVLNICYAATRNLTIETDVLQFAARFNGVSREVSIPIGAVTGIFARENGQGMFFPKSGTASGANAVTGNVTSHVTGNPPKPAPTGGKKPKLQVVK